METKFIAKINQVDITVGSDEKKLVPIKPICEALGIDFDSQRQKLKENEDLNSVAVLSTATGSDGKQYEMVCLPLQFVFGWLFTINPKNVKPEAQEAVRKYRMLCYNVLYRFFTQQIEFNEEKQQLISEKVSRMEEIRGEFNSAKERLSDARKELNGAMSLSFDEWRADKAQLQLF